MGAASLTTESIGRALRALRETSGLTGDAIARRASMSAGKLSKIENGRAMPTVQDVDLILSALGVSDAVKEQFLATARAEVTEATAWRLLRRMGPWKHQNTIKAVEAHTAALRLFQGQLIPGLLQTPEYASAVFSLPPALADETRSRTVAARMERQATLDTQGWTAERSIREAANVSDPRTTMDGPVNLAVPRPLPEPAKGCGVCEALAGQRKTARDRGDFSAATDADVEIRNHPHRTRRPR
ncbi:Scr1 family TA system antitoxin-like transcriptional regulator [Streptomyces sp. NPDC088755]|uniref:Scr1 family TA system antitoxin-like transcriptional regulator n=1 Tax=Streptomyces sp. NPDC088755 TaxID=3365888 RepID=UPI00381AF394